jgi:hypothetical protein
MTDNTPKDEEDTQGHQRRHVHEEDDTQGHVRLHSAATEDDDDTEGHVRLHSAATEDDDVEGHQRRV